MARPDPPAECDPNAVFSACEYIGETDDTRQQDGFRANEEQDCAGHTDKLAATPIPQQKQRGNEQYEQRQLHP